MPGPYPGHSDEAFPGVFNLAAMSPQPKKKPGQLPEEDIRRFFEEVSNASDLINIWQVEMVHVCNNTRLYRNLIFISQNYIIFYVSCCFISSNA